MAESTDRGGFLRLGLNRRAVPATKNAPPPEGKSSLLPKYWPMAGGFSPDFIPLDNRGNVIDVTDGNVAMAFAAYWYIATRWRAQKLGEAPLMVVEEDQEDGSEEWLADHELAEILEMPNPDFDMSELIERTSRYLDDGAQAIWIIDRDNAKRIARLTPFSRDEFEVKRTADRLFGEFIVQTSQGKQTYPADRVVYFRDTIEGWNNEGKSRLDVAMSWLRLGERSRQTIRELLENAVWPSLVSVPDASWNPTPEMLELYKAELNSYGLPGNKGKAIALVGGGNAIQLAARIRELVPEEVLDRVESVVAAVSGVPAIVLQFQIGLVNSPWSQMEQARRMAYDDVIVPAWRKMEGVLTRQLLRIDVEDRTQFVRFDRSNISALQINRLEASTIASMMGRQASLNERRVIMGLEPLDDEAADEVPELTQPDPLSMIAGDGADDEEGDDAEEDDSPDDEEPAANEKARRRRRKLKRRNRVAGMSLALRKEGEGGFEHFANRLLANDANEIEKIVRNNLLESKGVKGDSRNSERVMSMILGYLRDTSAPAWAKTTQPVITVGAERATAVIAADVGINYNLLHPHVVKFAQKESAWLVKGITETTREAVANALAAGIEAGKSTNDIARDIANSGGFAPSRARLIARTESTRVTSGGPHDSLKSYSRASGRRYTKTWATAGDGRVRDEHVDMEGETVPIDEKFSNGRDYPDEPNCRCAPIFNEVEA